MPDEEHPAVGAGRGQRQGMSDAETAVVFDQGTGGALQLHAQQAVRKVIAAAWRTPGWTAGHTLSPSVSRLDSAGFPLHSRLLTASWPSSSVSEQVFGPCFATGEEVQCLRMELKGLCVFFFRNYRNV